MKQKLSSKLWAEQKQHDLLMNTKNGINTSQQENFATPLETLLKKRWVVSFL